MVRSARPVICGAESNRRARRLAGAPRTIHLIDLENLAGIASLTEQAAGWAVWAYAHQVAVRPEDLVVIAVDARNAFAAFAVLPTARLLIGRGKDGADNRLIEVLREEDLEDRFEGVVIASGDGIFAGEARRLAGRGALVTVVALPGHDSHSLRENCADVRYLGMPPSRDPRDTRHHAHRTATVPSRRRQEED